MLKFSFIRLLMTIIKLWTNYCNSDWSQVEAFLLANFSICINQLNHFMDKASLGSNTIWLHRQTQILIFIFSTRKLCNFPNSWELDTFDKSSNMSFMQILSLLMALHACESTNIEVMSMSIFFLKQKRRRKNLNEFAKSSCGEISLIKHTVDWRLKIKKLFKCQWRILMLKSLFWKETGKLERKRRRIRMASEVKWRL